MSVVDRVKVLIGEGEEARPASFVRREAWALLELKAAGDNGITALDHIGPRLSHYVMKLRRAGLAIETRDEKHSFPYSGRHGRYILRSPVQVIETVTV